MKVLTWINRYQNDASQERETDSVDLFGRKIEAHKVKPSQSAIVYKLRTTTAHLPAFTGRLQKDKHRK